MISRRTVAGIGALLLVVGLYLFPLGADVVLFLSIEAMGGNYWLGVLLMYVYTSALILVGLLLVFRPRAFKNPLFLLAAVGSVLVVTYLVVVLGRAM